MHRFVGLERHHRRRILRVRLQHSHGPSGHGMASCHVIHVPRRHRQQLEFRLPHLGHAAGRRGRPKRRLAQPRDHSAKEVQLDGRALPHLELGKDAVPLAGVLLHLEHDVFIA
eukprot:13499953-Alexandrium_andersonii.AAC.1